MFFRVKIAAPLLTALLLLALPLAGQVKTGDLTTSLSGTLAPGFSATFGNQVGSSHAWVLGGTGNLTGSYYNPSFLAFDVGYYLNQSRANSNFQSITDASGLNANTTIFGGSHFPGAVNYTKSYDSEGNYAIPGVANFVTHGNSDTFGVNWSANIPDKPSFSAGYQMGSSKYTIYGSNDNGTNHFRSLNLHSAYHLAGYNVGGFYTIGNSHALIPQIIAGQHPETHASEDSFGFNVAHRLPLQGDISCSFTRSDFSTDYLGSKSDGTIDLLSATSVIHPARKLGISGSVSYSDNLSGQLVESIVTPGPTTGAASGGGSNVFNTNESSNSLDMLAVATYAASENGQLAASVERRDQSFLGNSYGVTSYGLHGSFVHRFSAGNLNSSASMTANTMDKGGESALGFNVTENFSTLLGGWHLNGNLNYAQNVQTLLVTYMNSFYNFSANARHTWGKVNFSAAAAGSHTAITDQPGTANSGQSYSSTIGYSKWINLSGGYSKADGEALITGSGLVPVPVPPVVPSSLVSMYGGESYSFSASSAPARRMIFQASWSQSTSNTASTDIAGALNSSSNHNGQFDTLVQYQYRKLSFNAGFARLDQGFSGSAVPTQVVSSYYMGVSRWFKFF
ncbi:MAG TPA: hypothetical protein VGL22_21515 [Terracidiphilus sp.]